MTTALAQLHRPRAARHVEIVPKGKGILERIFGFTPKRQHRRATFVKS